MPATTTPPIGVATERPMSADEFKIAYKGGRRDFSNVVFVHGADLRGEDLWRVNLRGADLRGADLEYADLVYADLRGADLRDVKNLELAIGLGRAIFGNTKVTEEQKKIII